MWFPAPPWSVRVSAALEASAALVTGARSSRAIAARRRSRSRFSGAPSTTNTTASAWLDPSARAGSAQVVATQRAADAAEEAEREEGSSKGAPASVIRYRRAYDRFDPW